MREEKKARKILSEELTKANEDEDEEAILFLELISTFIKKVNGYSSATEQSYVDSTMMPWLEHYFEQINNTTKAW